VSGIVLIFLTRFSVFLFAPSFSWRGRRTILPLFKARFSVLFLPLEHGATLKPPEVLLKQAVGKCVVPSPPAKAGGKQELAEAS
jgi:hypothetical protein